MKIVEVSTKKQLKDFLALPYSLYKNDASWIAPLKVEQKKMFDGRKNHMLSYCDYVYFLAYENDKPVGRIAAFIDSHFNDHWGTSIGNFGSYECIQNAEISQALLSAARDWLTARNMNIIRGPISFESQNWGFVFEGFNLRPMMMSPYNPPYYNDQMEQFGLHKVKDLVSYGGKTTGYELPERFRRHYEKLKKKYGVTIRNINKKHMERDVRIITDLTNRSITGNWGFVPVSLEEAASIAKEMKPIIDPSLVFILESFGEPIGYSLALPDINVILKNLNGRLFPFGIFKLLFGLKKINNYRFWALGIVKGFQRRGLDTFLYLHNYKALKERDCYIEANYILENNNVMNDAILKLGLKKVRLYRIYEMDI